MNKKGNYFFIWSKKLVDYLFNHSATDYFHNGAAVFFPKGQENTKKENTSKTFIHVLEKGLIVDILPS